MTMFTTQVVLEGEWPQLEEETEGWVVEVWSGGTGPATMLREVPISEVPPLLGQALVFDGTEATWANLGSQDQLDALVEQVDALAASVAAMEVTVAELEDTVATVADHPGRTDNPHAVTAAQVGAYTTAQVDTIAAGLASATSAVATSLATHAARTDNPHAVTAAQVGAYTSGQTDTAIAAHAGRTDNPHATTAAQVGAYTTAQSDTLLAAKASAAALSAHIADTANPHAVTAAQVGAYTTAQVDTLLAAKASASALSAHIADTANPHATTAAQVGAYTTTQTDSAIAAHTGRTDNPHSTTAAQVGAYTTAQVDTLLAAKATTAALAAHIADVANPHAVTKAQVGLGNVENTALSTWPGTSSITTVGTLSSGAVPASLVTAGTFGAGAFTFGGTLTFLADNTHDIGASGAGRPQDLFLGRNATIGGTLGVTGASQFNGVMGSGNAPSAAVAIFIRHAALSGAIQAGLSSEPVFTSTATSSGWAIRARASTAAASFTVPDLVGVRVNDATKGAGSTITVQYGVYVDNQTQGATNYAIFTNTGLVSFGDTVITVASASAKAGLRVPHGAAPSSPVNGDFWTTTAGAFVRINGVTKTFTLT